MTILPMVVCNRNCVILQINRVRCTLNKEILVIYSVRKAFLERVVVKLVNIFDEKSTSSV